MKIDRVLEPKSSFLSVEKDMAIITNLLLQNDRLKKLLYYTTPDVLSKPILTAEQSNSLIGKNIKNVPKLYVDGSVLNYIIVNFDNFYPSSNPEFRDNIIEFDIVCHFDQWNMGNFKLRPYRIAAEIDSMLDKKRLSGIGKTEFSGASQIILNDEFAGLCLLYKVYHGEEDKKPLPEQVENPNFLKGFLNEMGMSLPDDGK